MNLKKFLAMLRKGRPYNIREGSHRRFTVIYSDESKICGKITLRIKGVSRTLTDMEADDLKRFLKSYFNMLNVGFPIEISTRIFPISTEKYLERIDKKIDTLKVILEDNPSLTGLKDEIRRLENQRKSLLEGNHPLKIEALIYIYGCAPSSDEVLRLLEHRAKTLRDVLSSLGIRASPIESSNSEEFNQTFFRELGIPTSLPRKLTEFINSLKPKQYLILASNISAIFFPFLLGGKTEAEVSNTGIIIGTDPLRNSVITWDPSSSTSPHVIVVGPTGSGKTTFLTQLVEEFRDAYGAASLIIDVKGEYKERLDSLGIKYVKLRLGEDAGVDLCKYMNMFPPRWRGDVLTDVIAQSFSVFKLPELTGRLHEAIELATSSGCHNLINSLMEYIRLKGNDYYTFKLATVLHKIELLERDDRDDMIAYIIDFLAGILNKPVILDLSYLLGLEPELVVMIVSITSNLILSMVKEMPRVFTRAWKLLIFDEGWLYIRPLRGLIAPLLRLGRSYRLSVAIATQDLKDLEFLGGFAASNTGLLIALSSTDKSYWKGISSYMNINDEEVTSYISLLRKCEGVARVGSDPKGRPVTFKTC